MREVIIVGSGSNFRLKQHTGDESLSGAFKTDLEDSKGFLTVTFNRGTKFTALIDDGIWDFELFNLTPGASWTRLFTGSSYLLKTNESSYEVIQHLDGVLTILQPS
jgi:hypothetical protein